jgi:nucleoside phosphorylase
MSGVLKILVTFALRQEGVTFERRLRSREAKFDLILGFLDSQEIAIFWLGTGVGRPVEFQRALSDGHFDLVINAGFAGAVQALLAPGAFVLCENFTSPEWLDRLRANSLFDASGPFASVNTIAGSEAKRQIAGDRNIVALDMESAQVAAVCRRLSVPLVSARMISDRFDEEIPGVFLGKGIRRPRDVSAAIAFAGRMIVLRRRLADRLVGLIRVINLENGGGDKPQITQI